MAPRLGRQTIGARTYDLLLLDVPAIASAAVRRASCSTGVLGAEFRTTGSGTGLNCAPLDAAICPTGTIVVWT